MLNFLEIEIDGAFAPNGATIHEVVSEVCLATTTLYRRKGFVRPWIGYLAERDGKIIGTCGFNGPVQSGRVEIAYFTFPGNEGQGIGTLMAGHLVGIATSSTDNPVVFAYTSPERNSSTTILGKLGFICSGRVTQTEDGKVFEWVLD